MILWNGVNKFRSHSNYLCHLCHWQNVSRTLKGTGRRQWNLTQMQITYMWFLWFRTCANGHYHKSRKCYKMLECLVDIIVKWGVAIFNYLTTKDCDFFLSIFFFFSTVPVIIFLCELLYFINFARISLQGSNSNGHKIRSSGMIIAHLLLKHIYVDGVVQNCIWYVDETVIIYFICESRTICKYIFKACNKNNRWDLSRML